MTTLTSQTNTEAYVIPEWTRKLFRIFAANYKNLWTDPLHNEQMRKSNDALWIISLKNYSSEIIFKAAEDAIKTHKYPPSIAEFLEIVTSLQRQEKYNIEMAEREKNRLLEKEPNKEVAKLYMAKIMKKLGRK